MVFRAGISNTEMDFVAIKDLTDTKTLAHLLKYDSVHGKFDGKVDFDDENLIVNGKKIRVFDQRDPTNLPWKESGIAVVIESTGFFLNRKLACRH